MSDIVVGGRAPGREDLLGALAHLAHQQPGGVLRIATDELRGRNFELAAQFVSGEQGRVFLEIRVVEQQRSIIVRS